jgi:hypothetical protein
VIVVTLAENRLLMYSSMDITRKGKSNSKGYGELREQ